MLAMTSNGESSPSSRPFYKVEHLVDMFMNDDEENDGLKMVISREASHLSKVVNSPRSSSARRSLASSYPKKEEHTTQLENDDTEWFQSMAKRRRHSCAAPLTPTQKRYDYMHCQTLSFKKPRRAMHSYVLRFCM